MPPGASIDGVELPLDRAAAQLWSGAKILLEAFERGKVAKDSLPMKLQAAGPEFRRKLASTSDTMSTEVDASVGVASTARSHGHPMLMNVQRSMVEAGSSGSTEQEHEGGLVQHQGHAFSSIAE